jgi:hypothetical protein
MTWMELKKSTGLLAAQNAPGHQGGHSAVAVWTGLRPAEVAVQPLEPEEYCIPASNPWLCCAALPQLRLSLQTEHGAPAAFLSVQEPSPSGSHAPCHAPQISVPEAWSLPRGGGSMHCLVVRSPRAVPGVQRLSSRCHSGPNPSHASCGLWRAHPRTMRSWRHPTICCPPCLRLMYHRGWRMCMLCEPDSDLCTEWSQIAHEAGQYLHQCNLSLPFAQEGPHPCRRVW